MVMGLVYVSNVISCVWRDGLGGKKLWWVIGVPPALWLRPGRVGCVHLSPLLLVHIDGFSSHPANYQIVF